MAFLLVSFPPDKYMPITNKHLYPMRYFSFGICLIADREDNDDNICYRPINSGVL